jgi:hypothetical protein
LPLGAYPAGERGGSPLLDDVHGELDRVAVASQRGRSDVAARLTGHVVGGIGLIAGLAALGFAVTGRRRATIDQTHDLVSTGV